MSEEARKATREDAKKFGEANRAEGGDGWQLMADFANDHADHTAAIREKSLALVARLAKVFTDCEGLAYDHDIDNELTALKAALEGNDEDTDA